MDKETVIYAIERADCILPPIDGYLEYLNIDGVTVCVTPLPHSMANRVSNARLDAISAEPKIREIKKVFTGQKKAFSWTVGPHSSPSHLGQLLEGNGLEPTYGSDGMYMDIAGYEAKKYPGIKIIEVPADNPGEAVTIMVEGFGITEESSRFYHDMLYHSNKHLPCKIYIAYDKEDRAVGCCYMTYYPDQPVALLGGATTIPGYRGRGFYTAMLSYRMEDARRDGMETVIIIADRTSSAPICRKNGFKKICNMELYVCENEFPF